MRFLSVAAVIGGLAVAVNWWTNITPAGQDQIMQQCWPLFMLLSIIFFAWLLRSEK